MRDSEARELLRDAVRGHEGVWADLGAGEGTFTRALAGLLAPTSRIYAVDRDARALDRLNARAKHAHLEIIPVAADFTRGLPDLEEPELHGMLLANALHYVADPGPVMARLAARLRAGGRMIVIEYDRRRANPWVPHPIAPARLTELAAEAGLSAPRITAHRPSAYGGDLYVAVMERLAPGPNLGP